MKKLLLSLVLVFFSVIIGLHAQCVIDGSITHPGTYPDSVTGLPHAKIWQSYSTVIQIRVLTDTTVSGLHATVDSIVLNSVTGLPAGFSYATNPSSKSFPGGSNACAILYSTTNPTPGMEGSHPLSINLTAYGKIFGSNAQLPYAVTYYNLYIDSSGVGINELSGNKFELLQNSPNPAVKMTDIYYSVPTATPLEFKMYNLIGKIVYQKSFFAQRGVGRITFDAKDFSPGIYMYQLSNGKAALTRRLVMASN